MQSTKIVGKLCDECTSEDSYGNRLEVAAELTPIGIFISADGYGDSCGCEPIMIEHWNGELRVLVWAGINQEDPTHIISLDKAKLCNLAKESYDSN